MPAPPANAGQHPYAAAPPPPLADPYAAYPAGPPIAPPYGAPGPGYPGAPGTPPTPPPGYPAGFPAGSVPAAPAPSRWRKWMPRLAIGAVMAIFIGIRVYHDVHPNVNTHSRSAVDAGVAACQVDGAHSIALDKGDPAEPNITVPLTPGWKPVDYTKYPEIADPRVIRGDIANTDIREKDMTPYFTVNVGPIDDPALSLQQIVDQSAKDFSARATLGGQRSGTACGAAVYGFDFTDWRPQNSTDTASGTQLATIVTGPGGARWVAVALMVTENPDNPSFAAQRDALLKGFQVSFS